MLELLDQLSILQALLGAGIAHTGPQPFHNDPATVNTANNYAYDALGNLVRDTREGITGIEWTAAGKVRNVTKATGPSLAFAYGASGQRTIKQVGDPDLDEAGYREHYIRDAQGNIMATYRYSNTVADGLSLKLNERPLYGSSRLGSLRKEEELRSLPSFGPEVPNTVQQVDLNYELTDHLGNVAAVVTGRLLDGNGGGTPKQAELISAQGYEPFGSLLPGRNYSSSTYRYGFQRAEKDDEVQGATGTSYDFGARLYDSRVSRWLSIDPAAKQYPGLTSYGFTAGNPIWFVELDGRIFDLSNMSAGQREQYNAAIERLSASALFRYYHERMSQSSTVYTVNFDPTLGRGGGFDPTTNTVQLANMELYTVAQEIFHGYQVSEYGKYDLTTDRSNMETEGDLMSMYVQWDGAGGGHHSLPWADGLVEQFGGTGEVPSVQQVQSDDYYMGFLQAVKQRVDHYKEKDDAYLFTGYTKPMSFQGPEAMKEVFRQADPELIGPRMENGDFYAD